MDLLRIFISRGRSCTYFTTDFISLIRVSGMGWLMILKQPHFSHASLSFFNSSPSESFSKSTTGTLASISSFTFFFTLCLRYDSQSDGRNNLWDLKQSGTNISCQITRNTESHVLLQTNCTDKTSVVC